MKRYSALSALVGALFFCTHADAGYLIDDFNSPNYMATLNDTNTPGTILSGFLADGTAIGGGREVDLSTVQTYAFGDSSTAIVSAGAGKFTLNNSDSIIAMAHLLWNGNGAGLGKNMYDGGSLSLLVDVLSADVNSAFKFTLTDSNLMTSTMTITLPSNILNQTLVFDFLSFVGSADLTDIDSIELELTGSPSLDVSITAVRGGVVPEPTSLALAGFAGIGMAVGAIRRRRQAKQAA